MRQAELWRRAAGVYGVVGQGAPGRHFGRWLCLNCPRDHHEPPFLPFRLPIHIREHRDRFPDHALAWWCWDDLVVEEIHSTGWRWVYDPVPAKLSPIHPNGGSPMTQPASPADAVLGVCQPCGSVWVVTLAAANCLACGQPPSNTLPIPNAGGAPIPTPHPTSPDGEPPAEPVTIPLDCPDCNSHLEVTIFDDGTLAIRSSPATPAPEADDSSDPPSGDPSGSGVDEPTPAPADTPPVEPASCATHPTETLDADGKCAPCVADAEASLRREALSREEPAL